MERAGWKLDRAMLVGGQTKLLIRKIADEQLQLDIVVGIVRLEGERVNRSVPNIVRQDTVQHVRGLVLHG